LFPQTNGHWRKNSFACWDFGMTGSSTEDYNTNEGVQPKAIKRMVDRLTSPKNSTIFSENDIDSSFDYTASTYFLS
jgi:short subunit fatty acids transporter